MWCLLTVAVKSIQARKRRAKGKAVKRPPIDKSKLVEKQWVGSNKNRVNHLGAHMCGGLGAAKRGTTYKEQNCMGTARQKCVAHCPLMKIPRPITRIVS